ncbi:MAG TPA: MBL fold metallo-hydrolase [Steroidobacteraceae bacterium]|nr:MBL fold metallo-hydrolase [Steroidobacteraceae bacterium]
MDRRHFLGSALPAGAALALFTRDRARASLPQGAAAPAAAAPAPPAAPTVTPPTVTALTERIFVVAGRSNVTVFNAPQGVLLVDGGPPEQSGEILRLIRERTGRDRVHTLFNTHWHWDQTGSNRTLGPAGTRIIAHENTRLWLSTEVDCKWQHRVYEPLPAKARPNQTFYTTGSLDFGGEKIDYGYLPQAHTDGDIYVRFSGANVLAVGDVLSVGSYPILDWCTNGWIGGMLQGTQTLLGLADAGTRIVPGSGPVQSRPDLSAEHDMLAVAKHRLSELLARGSSVQDMLDAAPLKEFDARWGDPTLFISNAWPGLVQRARELGVHIV